jgi:hypothetical protein
MGKMSYKKGGVEYHPLKTWSFNDQTEIGIYQGFRGENPDLDFIVKYKSKGQRLRTPSHTHWIVDLLVKCEYSKETVGEYVQKMLDYYERTKPFNSVDERNNYELSFYPTFDYDSLNQHGYYSIETLTAFIELFTKCEKQTTGAFMFKTLLQLVKDYCDGKKDFYQIVGYSKRV